MVILFYFVHQETWIKKTDVVFVMKIKNIGTNKHKTLGRTQSTRYNSFHGEREMKRNAKRIVTQ